MNGKEKGISKEEMNSLKEILDQLEDNENSYEFRQPVDYVKFGLDDYPKIIKQPMDLLTVRKRFKDSKYFSAQEMLKDIQLIWDNCKLYNADGSEIYKLAVKLEKFTKKIVDKAFKNTPTPSKEEKKSKDKKARPCMRSNNNVNPSVNPNENEDEPKVIEEIKTKEISEINNINNTKLNEEPLKKQISSINEKHADKVKPHIEEDDDEKDSIHISVAEREKFSERVKRLANDGLASLVRLIQKECPNCIQDVDDERLMIKITEMDRKTYEQINQLIDTFLKVRETNQENLENKRIKEKIKDI